MNETLGNHLFDLKDDTSIDSKLSKLLSLVRKHLNMEVAFISEFIENERVFKFVDNQTSNTAVQVGNADIMCETYCQKIADNKLSSVIKDTHTHPITKVMPVTEKLNIGSYIGVPITLSCGGVYGSFCCYKSDLDDSLNDRDLSFLRLISEIATELIEKKIYSDMLHHDAKSAIQNVIETNSITTYFQPIFNLITNKLSGYEALSRFFIEPYKTPDIWFKEASELCLGESLEMLAIKNTLSCMHKFNDAPYIAINTSPEHILTGALAKTLQHADCSRIILEVTEHSPILDYQAMRDALKPLRDRGVKLAIDDVGAGFSSFQHILELEADIIKLDISLTQNINKDRRKFLLAKALCGFAKAINCSIVAEGIETQEEITALRKLGVDNAQGYFIGRPAAIDDALIYQTHILSY